MLNLDPAKLLIIAVVAVLLLGPDKLPHFARQVGATWRTIGEYRHRVETEVRKSIPDLPSSGDISRLVRSPTALLDHLSTLSGDGGDTPTPSNRTRDVPSPVGDDASGSIDDPSGPPLPSIKKVVSDPQLN